MILFSIHILRLVPLNNLYWPRHIYISVFHKHLTHRTIQLNLPPLSYIPLSLLEFHIDLWRHAIFIFSNHKISIICSFILVTEKYVKLNVNKPHFRNISFEIKTKKTFFECITKTEFLQ